MIKSMLRGIAGHCGVSDREAALYLVLSIAGWLYFAYQFLFETGLGVAIPKYAGY